MLLKIFKECGSAMLIGGKTILKESAIHIYLFKTASALIAFLATAYFTNLFALLPLESQVTTSYEMAQAEVNYYMNSENNAPKDIALAQGKLNAAEESKKLISAAVSLLESIAEFVFLLLWPVWVLGIGHWWLQAIQKDHDSNPADLPDEGGEHF
ncbi:hypothetical protein QPI28_004461 [Vibrio parahaemolyticus]|nr:hypothetical protein [Vibrio parahaemolyticus]ELA7176857.1 hypothetical protein [Vibrio parahaemolyticus]ELA7459346.1 hypothetical protein [Vibrio parahaemolyticus]ELA7483309.1 hypothetical protein [Vibrio parahaemolyticus]ELA7905849.1 hypothetical protein [Vibrio parahaemolyticus]